MLKCTLCLETKPIESFSKDKYKSTGRRSQCKECNKKDHIKRYTTDPEGEKNRTKIWRENNKDTLKLSYRKWSLKKNYGLTLEDYSNILKSQNNVCAICNSLSYKKQLAVDHCHKTGKIRELLCGRCNTALGLVNDDLILIDKVRQYIEKHLEV